MLDWIKANQKIKTFLMPAGGGYMGEIEYWMITEKWTLAGPPSPTKSGAMLWTLVAPAWVP